MKISDEIMVMQAAIGRIASDETQPVADRIRAIELGMATATLCIGELHKDILPSKEFSAKLANAFGGAI